MRLRWRRIPFIARAAIVVTTIGLVVGLAASWFVGERLVAPWPQEVGDPPESLAATSFSLPSESGSTLAGWHVRSDKGQGVVVLLHPLRGTRKSMLERARMLQTFGYSVVMIDFQAHGESPGEHITMGCLEQHDVRAAVEFARREHPGEPIGVIGVSMGGAAAVLASPLGVDALVLESVYPTVTEAVHNRVRARLSLLSYVPAELLLVQLGPRLGIDRSELSPIEHMAEVGCPVLLISGADDRYTTPDETRRMFAAARQPKELWIVECCGHSDILAGAREDYMLRVIRFLDQHMGVRRESSMPAPSAQ